MYKLTSKKIIRFITFWEIYNNLPLDVYVFILNNSNDFNNIENLQYFICQPPYFAAEYGNLELLNYLHENNFEFEECIFPVAEENGNLDNMPTAAV